MKAVINARIYTGVEEISNGFVLYDQKVEKVANMSEWNETLATEVIDAAGKVLIPGMIDVHIHGGYDVDVMDANPETLVKLGEELLQEGVTSYFPTTMTQHPDAIHKALEAVNVAQKETASIAGIHLEGPFVSKPRAGAQPIEYIVPPNTEQFKKWFDASGNLIRLVTYAPEEEGAKELEQFMSENNVVGSAGHTDGVYDTFKEHKVTHFTHLYNQMRGLHHREPGVVGYALLAEDAYVEVIPDGIHIHPEMIKLAYRLKGAEKVCVITDAMRAKGLPDGNYELGGQVVILHERAARLVDGTLAGSVLRMDEAFRNIMTFTGCSVHEAVLMTSVNQAKEFGLETKGGIQPGKDADFVLMDENYSVEATFTLGRKVNI